jgi:hypothetical protein
LTADEWLHELYPTITTTDAEEGTVRSHIEHVQWKVTLRALQLGCNVILDWGVCSRGDFLRQMAFWASKGASPSLLSQRPMPET